MLKKQEESTGNIDDLQRRIRKLKEEINEKSNFRKVRRKDQVCLLCSSNDFKILKDLSAKSVELYNHISSILIVNEQKSEDELKIQEFIKKYWNQYCKLFSEETHKLFDILVNRLDNKKSKNIDESCIKDLAKLKDEIFLLIDFVNSLIEKSKIDREINGMKREKIISSMHNLISYINYRSNGTPKKITTILENFITKSPKKRGRRERYFIAGRSANNLYLHLNFTSQYKISLMNYINMPISLTIQHKYKNFEDKLLVSSSFILDHLLKFHKSGFSWRDMELIPEILDINKAPELRGLVDSIIDSLLTKHLRSIISGFFDFRFAKKISSEISFLSK